MKRIAVLGFGSVGKKFAQIFLRAGYQVVVGLNDLSQQPALAGEYDYEFGDFQQAVQQADAVCLAIPFNVVTEVLTSLEKELMGKIIIDNTNPLNEDWSPLLLGQENSAAEEIARLLPGAKVVKAFNTIFADVMELSQLQGKPLTAFIASDHAQAKADVLALASAVGYAPLDVGGLASARYLEAMAHLNIQIAVGMQGGTKAGFCYLN